MVYVNSMGVYSIYTSADSKINDPINFDWPVWFLIFQSF